MPIRYFIALLVALLMGCSQSSTPTGPKKVELGVVNLTYNTPNKQDLGNGLSCEILVRPLGPKECELIVQFKKDSKVLDTQRNLPGTLDQPAEFGFENVGVTFTPHIGQ
ncbi:MAG: hypothetical protein ACXWKG_16305 [Limisphaerales bacterium]